MIAYALYVIICMWHFCFVSSGLPGDVLDFSQACAATFHPANFDCIFFALVLNTVS